MTQILISTADEQLDSPATCELCDRESDAATLEATIAAGWAYTWDGWLCPKHSKELGE